MDRTRIIEIIEAYGGHPAAWPDEERAAALAVVENDVSLSRIAAEARKFDRVLRDWACALVPVTDADAELAATAALRSANVNAPQRRWLPRAAFGGALAASLAIGGALMLRPEPQVLPVAPAPALTQIALAGQPGENVEAAQDMLVWGSVFTPTPEEEMVL